MREKANRLIAASIRDLALAGFDGDDKTAHSRILQVETFLRMAKRELK